MGAKEYRLAQVVDGLSLQNPRRQASRAVGQRVLCPSFDTLARGLEVIEKRLNTHRNFSPHEQMLCLAQQAV